MQRLKAVWQQLKLLWLVFRVILFEQLTPAFDVAWGFVTVVTAIVVAMEDMRTGLVVTVVGAVFYRPLKRYLLRNKQWLIRRGDSVEYSVPSDEDVMQRFETARVLRRMSREHVRRAGSFDADHLDFYEHFFLVDTGETNRVIPYEWIVSIETGELEL